MLEWIYNDCIVSHPVGYTIITFCIGLFIGALVGDKLDGKKTIIKKIPVEVPVSLKYLDRAREKAYQSKRQTVINKMQMTIDEMKRQGIEITKYKVAKMAKVSYPTVLKYWDEVMI